MTNNSLEFQVSEARKKKEKLASEENFEILK